MQIQNKIIRRVRDGRNARQGGRTAKEAMDGTMRSVGCAIVCLVYLVLSKADCESHDHGIGDLEATTPLSAWRPT